MPSSPRLLALVLALGTACASPGPPPSATGRASSAAAPAPVAVQAVRIARAMIGAPYRYGGASPRGFDCSGLVVYSFAEAGRPGLPRTAAALARRAVPVPLAALEPGDLLFFDLGGRKAAHVGIYLGGGAFVHAPSSGGRVERVDFEHPYWGRRIRRAGRLAF